MIVPHGSKQSLRLAVLSVLAALPTKPLFAQWQPPIVLPRPSFGIEEQAGSATGTLPLTGACMRVDLGWVRTVPRQQHLPRRRRRRAVAEPSTDDR